MRSLPFSILKASNWALLETGCYTECALDLMQQSSFKFKSFCAWGMARFVKQMQDCLDLIGPFEIHYFIISILFPFSLGFYHGHCILDPWFTTSSQGQNNWLIEHRCVQCDDTDGSNPQFLLHCNNDSVDAQ